MLLTLILYPQDYDTGLLYVVTLMSSYVLLYSLYAGYWTTPAAASLTFVDVIDIDNW